MKVEFDEDRLFYNKWEMYKLLSSEKVSCHLPYTEKFSSDSLNKFIHEKEPFFIKPIESWGGTDISFIQMKNGLQVQKQGYPTRTFPTEESLKDYLIPCYGTKTCIIQKKAPVIPYSNRPFDIRSHLQRDMDENWIYAGDLIRIGGADSIVSNVQISKGSVIETDAVLENLFESRRKDIKDQLVTMSFEIARILDKYYRFLDVGSDFCLDEQGELWLIEVNTDDVNGRPDYNLFNMLPDKAAYNNMTQLEEKRFYKWIFEFIKDNEDWSEPFRP